MPKAFPMGLSAVFIANNGFYSAVVPRALPAPTPLWTIATAPARTAGLVSTVYSLIIENNTGAAITGWLEAGGVVVTPVYHVNNAESAVISFIAGLNVGDQDINCNASVNAVNFQVLGIQV